MDRIQFPSVRKLLSPAVAGPLLMVVSGISTYAGASVAVGLFPLFPPFAVAWMRVAAAGAVLLVLVRPPRAVWTGHTGRACLYYGLATALMNMVFYEAVARIPLGLVVAVEFLGPVAVAAWTSRTVRDWLSLAAAGTGVVLIAP